MYEPLDRCPRITATASVDGILGARITIQMSSDSDPIYIALTVCILLVKLRASHNYFRQPTLDVKKGLADPTVIMKGGYF